MAYAVWSTLHLGNIADMDWDEWSAAIEDTSEILTTFGSDDDPLHKHITEVHTDTLFDTVVYTDNEHTFDSIMYDVGDGPVFEQLDSVPLMAGNVTFADGSTAYVKDLCVFQDTAGNLFLAIRDDQPLLETQGITSVEFTSVVSSNYSGLYQFTRDDRQFVCYAPGVQIKTPDGPRAVEALQPGDLVCTLDHGPQVVRWVDSNEHSLRCRKQDDRPVLIRAGALGRGAPAQDIIVSPQHRVLVGGGGQLQHIFRAEVFVPAKALTALPGIRFMNGRADITWIHFACDAHEVVFANGCLSESLLIGPMVVKGLPEPERIKLRSMFGALASDMALNGPPARECLGSGKARRMIDDALRRKRARLQDDIAKWDADLAADCGRAKQLDIYPSVA